MSRVFRRGSSWWIDFKDAGGRRIRRKVGPNKRIAREVLDGYLGKVAQRIHLGVIEDSSMTFSDFAEVWWERVSPNFADTTRERWPGIVEYHLKPFFAGPLRSITSTMAQSYVTKRLEAGAAAATVNVELRILKHIVRRAVSWEFLSRNPFLNANGDAVEGLRTLKESPGRVRYLTQEEAERLLAACDREPYLTAFVTVCLNTGMRRAEALSLTRASIDWSECIATLTKTKNGEAAHIPLNQSAMEALRSLPSRLDGRLFPLNGPQVTMAFVRAVRRAGIENFHLHDTRHSFASWLAMGGMHTRGLQVLLRHKSPAMTARYSHLSEGYLREAVDKLSFGKKGTHLALTVKNAQN